MDRKNYLNKIEEHYAYFWNAHSTPHILKGSQDRFDEEFRVLKFPPTSERSFWTYATSGMSSYVYKERLESFIYSPCESESIIEILTAVALFHQTSARLWYGHTVNFGRPWILESTCNYGLLSLPYLDGEGLEILQLEEKDVRFLWLLPITRVERDYKIKNGIEALEEQFEEKDLNYLDPHRKSVV